MEAEHKFQVTHENCVGFGGLGTCVLFHSDNVRLCYLRADKGSVNIKRTVLEQLRKLKSQDVAVVNIGIHHSPEEAYTATRGFIEGLQTEASSPFIVWRESAPQ